MTKEQWLHNLHIVVAQLRNHIAPRELGVVTSYEFSPEYLRSIGPAVMQFGCDPDLDLYSGEVNVPPSSDTNLRTAGGHIHIGGSFNIRKMVFAMDIYAGLPSVLMDEDAQRRSMYGRAGCFRVKHYGVEYRTLSNFWMRNTDLQEWAFDAAFMAAHNVEEIAEQAYEDREDIQACINNSDKALARRLMKKFNVQG